jgi:hypothetical protein
MEEREVNEKLLSRVDANRRAFVKRMLAGAAFTAPVLATFTLDALTPSSAQAQCLNCTSAVPEPSSEFLTAAGAVGLGIVAYRRANRKKNDVSADTDDAESTRTD